jgi:hypothetical protein
MAPTSAPGARPGGVAAGSWRPTRERLSEQADRGANTDRRAIMAPTLDLTPVSASTSVDANRSDVTRAVAQTFASIMQARYPGSTWLPVFGSNGSASPRSRKSVRVLPVPHDLDALGDVPAAASAAADVDGVYS